MNLLPKAQEAFSAKNYNEAIRLAKEIVEQEKDDPKSASVRAAKRLIGLSQFGLRELPAAFQSLSQLAQQKEVEKDAAFMEALAISGRDSGQAKPADVTVWINNAIALYDSEGNMRKQLDLLFELAQWYQDMGPWRNQQSGDWAVRSIEATARALETFDRALKVGGEINDQLRALRGKVNVLLNYGHQVANVPREKWPAGLAASYDLTKPFDLAIQFSEEIVRRWPERPSAAEALLQIGDIQSQYLNNFVAAVATYQSLVERYALSLSAGQAKQRIAEIQSPRITIQPADISLPGSKATYSWWARNVKSIEVEAYPIDLFAVLKKLENLSDLPKIEVKGKAAAQWTIATGDKGDYQPVNSGKDALESPLTESNAYLVIARGVNAQGAKSEARAIFLISKLGLISKNGKGKATFFAMDTVSGEPRPQTQLLVQRFVRRVQVPILNTTKNVYAYHELTVPDNGLAVVELPQENPRNWQHQLIAVSRHGNDYAVTDAHFWSYWWGYADDGFQVYSYTDRPVYRPGQKVYFKHIVRQYHEGEYRNAPGLALKLIIRDARGQAVYEKEHTTTDEGSLDGELTLAERPALGMYHMSLEAKSGHFNVGPGASFRVEEYKKPEFKVAITTDKPLYRIGDRLGINIRGDFFFGGPVADAKVTYTIHRESFTWHYPWPRPFDWFYDEGDSPRGWWFPPPRRDLVKQGELTTNAEGNAVVEIVTEPFESNQNDDLQYVIDVEMVDSSRRVITASQTVRVTRQAFSISLDPRQSLYQPGDTVRVGVKAQNPNNQPVSIKGEAAISLVTQREERDESGNIKQKEQLEAISKKAIETNERGEAEVEFIGDREGLYKVVVETADPFAPDAPKITGSTYVWVAKGKGALAHHANRDLELVLERDTYQVGQTMRMLLNCRHPKSYVLLTAEGDDLYRTEVVYVEGTQLTLEWPIERSFQPNLMIRAATFRDNKIFQEERSLRVPPVEQFLTVKIVADKEEFRPREEADVAVEVLDHQGKPVQGVELSLGVFDASILYIQPETRGDIRKFFFGRPRPVTVQTNSSFFFRAWSQGGTGGVGAARGDDRSFFALEMRDAAPAMAGAPAPMNGAMAKSARKEANDEADKPAFAATEIRTDFRDSIFWGPRLKTGSDGKASARIQFPDSLTTWRLTSITADTKTRVGEVAHEVRTKKNILVRLQAPRFIVEGDRVVLSAIAHNYLKTPKSVKVSLELGPEMILNGVNTSDAFAKASPIGPAGELTVEIPPGGEKRVDFVAIARSAGKVKLLAKALTDEESDAMQLEIPSYEYGAQKLLAESGILASSASGASATARLEIPAQIRAGSQTLTITMSPTIAGVMLESLPYLLEYPYGCTEQTMSRFLPAVLTSSTLSKLGIKLEDLAKIQSDDEVVRERLARFRENPVFDSKELAKIIHAGVDRLADFQRPDGGWGWWKQGESSPYMTAYVVAGLTTARDAGIELPKGMLDRGVSYLVGQASRAEPVNEHPWQRGENTSLRAYTLYAIGQADASKLASPELKAQLRRIFDNRDALTDYARALAAIALADSQMNEEALLVLSNIKDRARLEEETSSASWGTARGFFYWYDSGNEATAYSLRALVRLEPNSPLIPKVVNWLVRHRQGTRWFNTKDTAIVCYSLADYLKLSGELDPDMEVAVEIDGKVHRQVRVTRDNIFTFDNRLELSAEALGTGAKQVIFRTTGRGNLYWGAYAQFFTKEEQITAGGNELLVTRSYERLIPKEVTRTRKVFDREKRKEVEEKHQVIEYDRQPLKEGEKLSSGDLIEVVLSIDAKNNFEYLVFEDPKPAGCEPTELRSGYQWGDGLGAHTELRDEKVAFFASYINQGKHRIAYRLRAEIPGEFHALPARGESMYTPFVQGNAASAVIRIVDAKE